MTLPTAAAWRHCGAREGFEVVFFTPLAGEGVRLAGHAAARQGDEAFGVRFVIDVDAQWRTRRVHVAGRSLQGEGTVRLEGDGDGRWFVDGRARRDLDGCLDVDLEASVATNALPVHRLRLAEGDHADVPAAYVSASAFTVGRLEQQYRRVADGPAGERYDYEAPAFAFRCRLEYDGAGLVLDYPGLAVRSS